MSLPSWLAAGLLLELVTRQLFDNIVLLGRERRKRPQAAVDRPGHQRKYDQQSQTLWQFLNPDSASFRAEILCGP
jgi:hypothetical protein